jgi:hypothetical protein
VVLGIGHDDNHTFVVVVPLTGRSTTESEHGFHAVIDVVDGEVEVQSDLSVFSLMDRLECEARQSVASLAQVDPVVVRGSEFPIKQKAPKSSDTLDVSAVNCYSGPHDRHGGRLMHGRVCAGPISTPTRYDRAPSARVRGVARNGPNRTLVPLMGREAAY